MKLDYNLTLASDQYFPEVHPKTVLCLHHTVGGSARSTWEWWNHGDLRPIATAYLVERDGTVYECFPPRYWAWHINNRWGGRRLEQRTIGIEICSEGALREVGGKLYAFDRVTERTRYIGPVYAHSHPWRGYRNFAAYTSEAIESTLALVEWLLELFPTIPRVYPGDTESAHPMRYGLGWEGIIGHAHLRHDKSDVHPGFPWARMARALDLTPL
jgi:N-acetyl-anhydromuramyl-L-alanine amidase AmpD